MQAYKLEYAVNNDPWTTLPRRFESLDEAKMVGQKLMDIHDIDKWSKFAIRYVKVV